MYQSFESCLPTLTIVSRVSPSVCCRTEISSRPIAWVNCSVGPLPSPASRASAARCSSAVSAPPVVFAGPAEQQPAQLVDVRHVGLGEQADARIERRAGDHDADPHVEVRPGRLDVEARVLDRPDEGEHAAVDAELLPVRLVGAVHRPQRAVDAQPAAGRGDVQLAAQPGIEAAAADPKLLAHRHPQVEIDLARARRQGRHRRRRGRRRGRCRARGRRRRGRRGAPAGRRITSTSSPRLGASEWLKSTSPSSTPKRPSSASVVASSRSEALPLVTMRRSTRPSISKRSAVSLSRAAGASSKLASPSSETLPLAAAGGELLDPRAAALQGDRDAAFLARSRPARSCARRGWRLRRGRCIPARRSGRRSPRWHAARRSGASRPAPIVPRCRGWRRAPRARPRSACAARARRRWARFAR